MSKSVNEVVVGTGDMGTRTVEGVAYWETDDYVLNLFDSSDTLVATFSRWEYVAWKEGINAPGF